MAKLIENVFTNYAEKEIHWLKFQVLFIIQSFPFVYIRRRKFGRSAIWFQYLATIVAGLTKYGEGKFSTAKYEGKYPKENNSSRSQVLFSESEIAFVGSEMVSLSFLEFSVMRGLLNWWEIC